MVQTLEIQDDDTVSEDVIYNSQEEDKPDQQVEVHVLQSGQIEFATPASESCEQAPDTIANLQSLSAKHRLDEEERTDVVGQPTESVVDFQCSTPSSKDATQTASSTESSQKSFLLDKDTTPDANAEDFSTHISMPTISNSVASMKDLPLIIRRATRDVAGTHDRVSSGFVPTPLPSHTRKDRDPGDYQVLQCDPPDVANDSDPVDAGTKLPRRSSRRILHRSNNGEETTGLKGTAYNLRLKQNLSGDLLPPAPKKRQLEESGCDNGLGLHSDPLQWGVAEVAKFISAVPRCNCTDIFREHVSMKAGMGDIAAASSVLLWY